MSMFYVVPRTQLRNASFYVLSLSLIWSGGSSAFAQEATELPAITVTKSRLFDRAEPTPAPAVIAPPRRAATPQTLPATTTAAPGETPTAAPPATIGITGASTSIITADDIAHSPAQTLPEIIGQTSGVQLQTLYGGVNGVNQSVDLRGFGAFASANTLLLINGRRVNDVDLQGVDFSTIPRDSIARIEITRGNSGAVLYGDNAVGGVINIVTKSGAGGPPATVRAEAGYGSFNQRMAAISATSNFGPWSTSFFSNGIQSSGYRANNALSQLNASGEVRYTTFDFSAFLNVSGDEQKLGFPGARTVDPSIGLDQLRTDRRGTSAPFDYGAKQGANVTAGFTKTIVNGVDLIVDGGVRDKKQQAGFFGMDPTIPFNYVDTHLQTGSITPRLSITTPIFGLQSKILTGVDYYDATYHSNRPLYAGAPPIHVYDLSQQTLAAYWQQTVTIAQTTDFSYGGRIQQTRVSARDKLDPTAPGYFGDAQALPLNSDETNHALHIGLEHRLNDVFSLFGRVASAFRTPNVDERVASGPLFDANFNAVPGTFMLRTQTSEDVEGGFRVKAGKFEMQSSVYNMNLTNEIHFDPVNFFNYNLDPTRRFGSETQGSLRVSNDVILRGGFAITRAVFTQGQFIGKDVPLVSHFTANGGFTWNIWQNYLVLDAIGRFWTSRRMDNDQANLQRVIPANGTIDLKLSGQYDRFFWSVSANNVLNALYYDYAITSAFTAGRFNAYPLPGRSYMVKAGATF